MRFHHHHCYRPGPFYGPRYGLGMGIGGAIVGAAIADSMIESTIASQQIAAANATAAANAAAAASAQRAALAQQQQIAATNAAIAAQQQQTSAVTTQVWNSLVTAEGYGSRGDVNGALTAITSFKQLYLSLRSQVDPASIPQIDSRVAALENWIRSAQVPPPPPPTQPVAPTYGTATPASGSPYGGLNPPPTNYL